MKRRRGTGFDEAALLDSVYRAKLTPEDFEGVRYRGSGQKAPASVTICAVAPYIQLYTEINESFERVIDEIIEERLDEITEDAESLDGEERESLCEEYELEDEVADSLDYESMCKQLEEADEVAEKLDRQSLCRLLEKLLRASEEPVPYKRELILPFCRFANGTQISRFITDVRKYGSLRNGKRKKFEWLCEAALLLSDTREAMLYADRERRLECFAEIRGTTEDALWDKALIDFGFESDGRIRYDLGNTVIEATVCSDLSVSLYDLSAKETVKTLPRKGADSRKYASCQTALSDLKKNAKTVVRQKIRHLFEEFLSGASFRAAQWIKVYRNNPIMNRLAGLLVWSQEGKSFTVTGADAVDSLGNRFVLNRTGEIVLAHPMEMPANEVSRWQQYFASHRLEQPFMQLWEPVKAREGIMEDRYKGAVFTYSWFEDMEEHGIYVYADNNPDKTEYDVDIDFLDCEAVCRQISWTRRYANLDDRFEIPRISFERYTRYSNHVVALLDKCLLMDCIRKDDDSQMRLLEGFTAVQIDEFLKKAAADDAPKCKACLEKYRNEHFGSFEE